MHFGDPKLPPGTPNSFELKDAQNGPQGPQNLPLGTPQKFQAPNNPQRPLKYSPGTSKSPPKNSFVLEKMLGSVLL